MRTQPKPRARQVRALQTRRRIVKAAYALFCARGYAGTTIEAIAKDAGVALQTLYFTFHTKAAILSDVLGAAIVGFEHWAPPSSPVHLGDPAQLRSRLDWFTAFEAEETARGALERFIGAGVDVMERTAPLISVLREAANDPEARAVYEIGESRRAETYRAVIRILAKREGGLRHGMTLRRATDVLLTIYSGETYQMLRDRGWTPRELRTWLFDVLSQQLLSR